MPIDRHVTTGVPRMAERLLAATLPGRGAGESMIGDLAEEYRLVGRQRGPRAARLWYWRQALALAGAIPPGASVARSAATPHPHVDAKEIRSWKASGETCVLRPARFSASRALR